MFTVLTAVFPACICVERDDEAELVVLKILDVADSRLDAVARDPELSPAPVRVRVPAAQIFVTSASI